jgi:hypothetical protein
MGNEALRAGRLERRASQQRPGFERRTILRQLNERRAGAGPHELDKAEAVHGSPLERLREMRVDFRRSRLPRCLATGCRQIDANRATDV